MAEIEENVGGDHGSGRLAEHEGAGVGVVFAVASVGAGFDALVGDDYPKIFGEPFKSMPTDQGYLVTYTLP